jgi:thiol-disulfide isomerase/thioredoxin
MISSLLILLSFSPSFAGAPAAAPAGPCQDEGKVYKVCSNQETLYAAGLERAKSAKKKLVVVVGAEWCPWCLSLHHMLNDPKFGKNFAKEYEVADIGLYRAKEKVPSGVAVLEKLKGQAHYEKKLEGIPVMVVVNPENGKAAIIDTEPLEKNTKEKKGHDAKKVLAALETASAEVK